MLSSRQVRDGIPIHPDLALVFDMDGVLIHSTPVHNEAWQTYLRRHGMECDPHSIEVSMLGKHNADIVRIFFGHGLPEADVARHGARKEEIYRRLMGPRLRGRLVPGVVDFLSRLAGAALGLATNAEPENVAFVLDGAGLRNCFQAVVAGHDVARPKPDPEIYLRVAALLGRDARNCIVFEDSMTGVAAARAAGARVVGVTTTTARLSGCDLVVADFLDARLPPWLGHCAPEV